MLKETIKYTDYFGIERKEDFYFNLTKAELLEMEAGITGGLSNKIQKIIDAQDTPALLKEFKDLVFKAYGVPSEDGKRFVKSQQLSEEFSQTEAYVEIYMKLATDAKAGADFIKGIIPKDIAAKMDQMPAVQE